MEGRPYWGKTFQFLGFFSRFHALGVVADFGGQILDMEGSVSFMLILYDDEYDAVKNSDLLGPMAAQHDSDDVFLKSETKWWIFIIWSYMDVSKNRGTYIPPKWMVKIMEKNPIKMDDLGVPLFLVQHPYQFILHPSPCLNFPKKTSSSWLNFHGTWQDLCDKPLGAADYLALGQAFHTIFIADIPRLTMQVPNPPEVGASKKISQWKMEIQTIQHLHLYWRIWSYIVCICMFVCMYLLFMYVEYIYIPSVQKDEAKLLTQCPYNAPPRMCAMAR